jgi:mannose-1-phosphate guanylyltransferase/mannose-6-phosphate isomerase
VRVGLALDNRMNIQNSNTKFTPDSNRPWGHCKSLTEQGRFKVRHLIIHAGKGIAMQSHFHRSEYWVAVSGSGRVTIDNKISDLYESQSIDIPIGVSHNIENHGKVDLHLIEVQTGAYLGEDDIIRYEN